MALRRLPVIDSPVAAGATAADARAVVNSQQIPVDTPSVIQKDANSATGSSPAQVGQFGLGVLSVHFEGGRCRVACPFCYLGERAGDAGHTLLDSEALVSEALDRLPYRELAIALSEPVDLVLPLLRRLVAVAAGRGKPVAITTTLAVARALPPEALSGVTRLNLSIDPWKGQLAAAFGQVEAADVQAALRRLPQGLDGTRTERVLIVTLSTPRFAEQVRDRLLAELLALPEVDRVALNALKPPPGWCDRAFWLKTLHTIRPLLREHLDRRLFLDCYVAARLLGIGGCPARPDLSPAPRTVADLDTGLDPDLHTDRGAELGRRGVAFRSCVYQREADFVVASADELAARLHRFTPPERCPFPIT